MADVEVWDVEVSADGGDQAGSEPGGARVTEERPASWAGEDRRGRVGDSDNVSDVVRVKTRCTRKKGQSRGRS